MNMAVEFEEEGKSLGEYLAVLNRRKKQLIIPVVVTFVVIALIALLWPPTYRSTATILIEEQEIPKDLVRSTITSYANQQIQVITQRTMTLKNIMSLVEKYELYDKAELQRRTKTEIAKEVQENVRLDLVSAEVVDPRSGRPTEATIAFTLSYDHKNPSKAQKVTNELVTLYLNENLKSRTEKSENTSSFLKSEATSLSQTLKNLEAALATFKEQNEGSLPELYQYNLSIIERTDRELLENALRAKELEKRKLQLEGEITQVSPYAPTVLATGEQVLSDYDRLKALESDYRRKVAVYSDKHPDVSRLKREIDNLKAMLGQGINAEDQAKMIRDEQDRLAQLKQKYTNDHPKVTAQQRVIEQLQAAPSNSEAVDEKISADNPAYIILDTQLKATIGEIKILDDKKQQLKNKIEKFEAYILKGPSVEKDYSAMRRDHENAQAKYREIKAKLMEAELAQNLEQGRKGERFTLIQPPVLPEKPVSPNRLAIVFVGLILSVAVGLAYIIVLEAMDPGIRGEKQLADVLGVQPLATVPYIQIDEEMNTQDKTKLYILGGLLASGLVALTVIHAFVKPLDVIWFVLLRKLGIG